MSDRKEEAADGTQTLPMEAELWAAGADHETARFVARQLRAKGYYLIRAEDIQWPDIHTFHHAGRMRLNPLGLIVICAIVTLASLFLLWLTEPAKAEEWTVPPELTGGGLIVPAARLVEKLDAAGTSVAITSSSCTSACTIYLTAAEVCVAAHTRFYFHGPAAFWTTVLSPIPMPTHGMDEGERIELVMIWARAFDDRWPGLGLWWVAKASHLYGMQSVMVRGAELNRAFGVPICVGG